MQQKQIIWNSSKKNNTQISIPEYLENNSDEVRRVYLEFTDDLLSRIAVKNKNNKKLQGIEFETILDMSLILEKSIYKTPEIIIVLKLIAFEKLIRKEKLKNVKIFGVENYFEQSEIIALLNSYSINYEFENLLEIKSKTITCSEIITYIYNVLYALFWYSKIILISFSLKNRQKSIALNQNLIITYFSILNTDIKKNSQLVIDHYWGDLFRKFSNWNYKTNLFYINASNTRKEIQFAEETIDTISKNSGKNLLFNNYLIFSSHSLNIIFSVLKKWVITVLCAPKFNNLKMDFTPKNSKLFLYRIYKNSWIKSIYGKTCIENIFFIEIFNKIMKNLSHQNNCIFLFEGQAWENALAKAWNKYHHGNLIGIAHSTIRFWDLRYFDCQRMNKYNYFLTVNSQKSYNQFIKIGYSPDKIFQVEALRYINLEKSNMKKNNYVKKLLILGDIQIKPTLDLINNVNEISHHLKNYKISFKPHFANPIKKELFTKINVDILDIPLSKNIHKFDIVYCANPTSSAVDAYISGLKTIIHYNFDGINFSPLRGYSNVYFVKNSYELLESLKEDVSMFNMNEQKNFWLNDNLPKWKNLIENFRI